MTINSINGANTQMWQMGMSQAADSYSRNIQNQIADAQKQLQELSSDKDMTQEEKMAKRQELQQKISDLNLRLRQRQMEQRQEKRQKQSSFDDRIGGSRKTGTVDTGALVSLSTSNGQIAVMKRVRTDLQGRLRVARTEEERADLQEKIDNVTQSMGSKAKETGDTISDHQRAEQDKKEDEKEDETNGTIA